MLLVQRGAVCCSCTIPLSLYYSTHFSIFRNLESSWPVSRTCCQFDSGRAEEWTLVSVRALLPSSRVSVVRTDLSSSCYRRASSVRTSRSVLIPGDLSILKMWSNSRSRVKRRMRLRERSSSEVEKFFAASSRRT